MEEYMKFIEDNLDKIEWRNLSANLAAIHLLETNPNKINWYYLSFNPEASHLLKANPDKIDWVMMGCIIKTYIYYQYYLDNIVNHK